MNTINYQLGTAINEDVFEASVLRFFIVFFKGCYDEYLLRMLFTFCWSLNLLMSFFPSKTWMQISLSLWLECCVCVCVCVYIHWIKTSLKLSLALFSVPSSKDGRMGRFWGRSLFPLCWRLNHLKCDGQCLFLSHFDFCSACEKSFLTGKECAYCR